MNDDRSRRFWRWFRLAVALGIALCLVGIVYMMIDISHTFDNIKD